MDQGRKEALAEQLDQQREILGDRYLGVRQELDVGYQLRRSLKKYPGRWAAAGAGAAILTLRLFRSRKVIYQDPREKRGLLFLSGRLLFKSARPALTTMALKYAQQFAETRLRDDPDNSMLGGPPQK